MTDTLRTEPCAYDVAPLPVGGTCPSCGHRAGAHWDGTRHPCTECQREIDERVRDAFIVVVKAVTEIFHDLVEAMAPLTEAFALLGAFDPATIRRLRRAQRTSPAARRQRATWQHVDRRRRARRRR